MAIETCLGMVQDKAATWRIRHSKGLLVRSRVGIDQSTPGYDESAQQVKALIFSPITQLWQKRGREFIQGVQYA